MKSQFSHNVINMGTQCMLIGSFTVKKQLIWV